MTRLASLYGRWVGGTPQPGWEFVPYLRGGDPVAIAALDGREIHFAIAPEWRGRLMTEARIREFLQPLLERKDFLVTRVPRDIDDHDSLVQFVERIGFERTGDSGAHIHYMLCALPAREIRKES